MPIKIICHQKQIRDATEKQDRIDHPELFGRSLDDYVFAQEPSSKEISAFVKTYEWMGSIGVSPRWICTARIDGILAGVVALNTPNAFSKFPGAKEQECLIQRGASASFGHEHLGSKLVMWAIRWATANTTRRVFYGYSDPRAGERGIIYSACNFEKLPGEFGAPTMFLNPTLLPVPSCARPEKEFSQQSLRRTSVFKFWFKNIEQKPWLPEYEKPNGFKNLAAIPRDFTRRWYDWGNAVLASATKINIPKKLKWRLILGRDKRETKQLRNSLTSSFGL